MGEWGLEFATRPLPTSEGVGSVLGRVYGHGGKTSEIENLRFCSSIKNAAKKFYSRFKIGFGTQTKTVFPSFGPPLQGGF